MDGARTGMGPYHSRGLHSPTPLMYANFHAVHSPSGPCFRSSDVDKGGAVAQHHTCTVASVDIAYGSMKWILSGDQGSSRAVPVYLQTALIHSPNRPHGAEVTEGHHCLPTVMAAVHLCRAPLPPGYRKDFVALNRQDVITPPLIFSLPQLSGHSSKTKFH